MTPNTPRWPATLRKPLAAASVPIALILGLLAVASAQEPTQQPTPAATSGSTGQPTPAGTATTPTPGADVRTVVRLEIDPGVEPIKKGTEFEVRVLVDNVEHLAGYSFFISYDPKRLEPVKSGGDSTPQSTTTGGLKGEPLKARGLGEFLTSSPRGPALVCSGPASDNNKVAASCVTAAPPVCLGGPAGASGSGLLGAVYFKSKGGGATTLTLTPETGLALDDAQPPCDPTDIRTQPIEHRRQDLLVQLGKSGSSNTMLYLIIGAVVLVIAAAGAGGYLVYGRRRTTGI